MNILFVIDNLGSGGAQNQLTLLAKGMKERGHTVAIFTYYPHDFFGERVRAAGIPIHTISKTDKIGWSVIRGLQKRIKRDAPDVVVAFLDTPNFYAALAYTLAGSKARLIVSYRSMTRFDRLSRGGRLLKEWVNRRAGLILANSHHERMRWQEAYPATAHKWKTLYNVVDLEAFKPTDQVVTAAPLKLICVGRVEPLKNPQLVIDALLLLRDKGAALPVIDWYGKYDFAEPDARIFVENIKRQLTEEGLEDYLRFFDPRSNINEVMVNYGALLHPSLLEGLPNVICEALAAGVPVLASTILDHPLLVEDGERGKLFDPRNASQLAEAISWVGKCSQEEGKLLQKNCRIYALSTFGEGHILDQFEELIG